MKTRKHSCPYLKNHRYCSHKRPTKLRTKEKIDCDYNKCEDCELVITHQDKIYVLLLGMVRHYWSVLFE